jgi:hypothetical protein
LIGDITIDPVVCHLRSHQVKVTTTSLFTFSKKDSKMRIMNALVLATAIGFSVISIAAVAGGAPGHAPKPSTPRVGGATVITKWQLTGGAKGQKSFQRSTQVHGKQQSK